MTAEGEFVHRHVHRAPPELLFACMTTPEHLTHFWGPVGTTTPVDGIVVDLRPGGAFETMIVSDHDGSQHLMRAVYETIDPPNVVAWREPGSGMVTTVTFTSLGDGSTEVVTRQRHVPEPYRAPDARAGWATSMDRYASYVATVAPPHEPDTPSPDPTVRTCT